MTTNGSTIFLRSVALLGLIVAMTVGARAKDVRYEPAEGDVVFQALPHAPLVDAIEGVTHSPLSHCGLVAKQGRTWVVIEAIGPVKETPLKEWIARGRGRWFAAYRWNAELAPRVPQMVTEARKFLGRPYDVHYQFDDAEIYCSELVFKAVRAAAGRTVGKVQKLGDLDWQPQEKFIRGIEGALPLEREMITPRALTEAPELALVFEAPKRPAADGAR